MSATKGLTLGKKLEFAQGFALDKLLVDVGSFHPEITPVSSQEIIDSCPEI